MLNIAFGQMLLAWLEQLNVKLKELLKIVQFKHVFFKERYVCFYLFLVGGGKKSEVVIPSWSWDMYVILSINVRVF